MAQASAEKLEQVGPAEKERVASVPQREQLASMPERLCQKEKEPSRQSRVPDHDGGESQGGRERCRSERKHGKERVESTMKEGRFQGGDGEQARRASLGEIQKT